MTSSSDDGKHKASDGRLNNKRGYAWCARVGNCRPIKYEVKYELCQSYGFLPLQIDFVPNEVL